MKQLMRMTRAELRKLCRAERLDLHGWKRDLAARYLQHKQEEHDAAIYRRYPSPAMRQMRAVRRVALPQVMQFMDLQELFETWRSVSHECAHWASEVASRHLIGLRVVPSPSQLPPSSSAWLCILHAHIHQDRELHSHIARSVAMKRFGVRAKDLLLHPKCSPRVTICEAMYACMVRHGSGTAFLQFRSRWKERRRTARLHALKVRMSRFGLQVCDEAVPCQACGVYIGQGSEAALREAVLFHRQQHWWPQLPDIDDEWFIPV